MRILVVSNYGYWGNFDPRAAYREVEGQTTQIGGGETAMVNIAHELAQLGHEVLVFYGSISGKYDGVDYLNQEYAVPLAHELGHECLIAWDVLDFFRFHTRSEVRVGAFQLNDAYVGVYDHLADLYMCPSKWHAARFKRLYPEMTEAKFRPTTTNGGSPALYESRNVARRLHKVVYSSSPDRGLHHLLAVWPAVKEAVPDAELHVYYDLDKWFAMIERCIQAGLRANTEPRYHLIRELLGELGRKDLAPTLHGGVSKQELADAHLSAHVLAYPCDPIQPTEGFSMTCLEGLMAGCYLVTTDADALGELWKDFEGASLTPYALLAQGDPSTFTEALVTRLLQEVPPEGPRTDPHLQEYHWSTLAKSWEREITKCLISN